MNKNKKQWYVVYQGDGRWQPFSLRASEKPRQWRDCPVLGPFSYRDDVRELFSKLESMLVGPSR